MGIFQDRLKKLKDESGKTQRELAAALEITPQAMSYYLNGREPGYSVLVDMAKYFETSTDYLLGMSEFRAVGEKRVHDIFMTTFGTNLSRLPTDQQSEILRELTIMTAPDIPTNIPTDIPISEVTHHNEQAIQVLETFLDRLNYIRALDCMCFDEEIIGDWFEDLFRIEDMRVFKHLLHAYGEEKKQGGTDSANILAKLFELESRAAAQKINEAISFLITNFAEDIKKKKV